MLVRGGVWKKSTILRGAPTPTSHQVTEGYIKMTKSALETDGGDGGTTTQMDLTTELYA